MSAAADQFTTYTQDAMRENLKDQFWRLNHLYWIRNKSGERVLFRMNESQLTFWREMWYRNAILKARQRGFTTEIQVYFLDTLLFRDDTRAGLIAHTLPDATEIFDTKICYPYDNLPEAIREWRPTVARSKTKIEFNNGSSLRVGTSMRSGTIQLLHVSEFGKIAATRPDKAREIRTGALEAVPKDGLAIFESTAEGMEGDFYNMCDLARKKADQGTNLTSLDIKFHFSAWWENPEYALQPHEAQDVIVSDRQTKYFDEKEGQLGIVLTPEQRAWYVKKEETNEDDMFREYPSDPDEAFQGSIQGAYYGKNMTRLRKDGRIGRVPFDRNNPVFTFWDLGWDDEMAIWFYQRIGKEGRLINYEEDSGENFIFYLEMLKRLADERGYKYGGHWVPHDAQVHELTNERRETRKQYLERNGMKPIYLVPRATGSDEVLAGIQATREFLDNCWIDAENCHDGIRALDNYKKKWDDKRATYLKTPDHTWASNGADSLRTGAMGFREIKSSGGSARKQRRHGQKGYLF